MRFRVILDFEAGDDSPGVAGAGDAHPFPPLAALQAYLDGMLLHQDLGTTIGVRQLPDLGFTAPRLVAALTEPPPDPA